MNLSRNVSEIIREHVTLSVESIDRMYLNVYQPQLQRDLGVVGFFRDHRGQPFASSSLMATMTRTFVASIESFKQQLRQEGIEFSPLDNGFLASADVRRLQRTCDGLSADKIDQLLLKWLRLLPHPFTKADRQAGWLYDISILQAEFSLTQVLDRPLTGRAFFEEVIHENLDLGNPGQVQLIFKRRV